MVLRGFLILSKPILQLKEVNKTYINENETIIALNNISIDFPSKKISMVVGPSGSGKSTLLRIAGLLEKCSSGSVIFDGKDQTNPDPQDRLYLIRNKIGFLPPYKNLFDYLTLLENVMLPMTIKDLELTMETLKKMGVKNINSYPEYVSLEDQQKAALARSIINKPQMILMDEPTSILSKSSSIKIMELIQSLKESYSIIIFTDNVQLTKYSDEVFKLNNGELV
ncbi:MAG: ATP-binding cassette domain-containing protein [Methanobacteriaceae archaeon]|nr:ATP-binding cassette domain-containing protein [Methanobacteriaceae archaeon]